ncbi:MAG: hypothetical protein WKF62_04665 [Solirubrobacterales bacterium]
MIKAMTPVSDRISKFDIGLALFLSLVGVYLMYENVYAGIDDFDTEAGFFALPLFLAVTVPVAWRRVAPLAALAVSLAALLVHGALFDNLVTCGVAFPVLLLLVFSAGSRLDLRESLAGLALALGGVAVVGSFDPTFDGEFLDIFAFIGPIVLAVWGIGRVVHSRVRLARALRARTTELRAARDQRAELEVATDRARLSGELDELLQRRLGELARLAGEGPRAGDAISTNAALVEIENQSRQTLDEMRALLGVLRDDSVDAETAPQPTLTGLNALLVRAKGAKAGLAVEGNPQTLPAGVELSAYRIVEHLLAALEDSDEVDVRVRFADRALVLEVSGPPRRRGAAAIERARERVALHHGTLETATHDGRSSATALLPVLSPA